MRRRLGWAAAVAVLLHLLLIFWGPFPARLEADHPLPVTEVWLPPSGQPSTPSPSHSDSSPVPTAAQKNPMAVGPVAHSAAPPAVQQNPADAAGAHSGKSVELVSPAANSRTIQERAVLRPPQCRRDPKPELPALSRALGEEGQVRLRLRVEADGRLNVTILQSSGFSRLDEAARAAAAQWRCQPAARAGRVQAAEIDENVVFRLD